MLFALLRAPQFLPALTKRFRFLQSEKAQGMVEYGLIIALIAVAVIATLTSLGGTLKNMFQSVVNDLGTPAG